MREFGGLASTLPWMVTFFVLTTLALVGLPMLSSFVGEFLILSGGMQAVFAHHVLWTVVGTFGVIFSAAYMLSMIQRVFYGETGLRPSEVNGWDIDAREHLVMWPLVALFLAMGVASPFWMRAIDPAGTRIARRSEPTSPRRPIEGIDATASTSQNGSFVDPALKSAALGKKAPETNPGARY